MGYGAASKRAQPWYDSGTAVLLASSGRAVGVGGTPPSDTKLYVLGDAAAQVVARLRQAAGQTGHGLLLESSGAAELFAVDAAGRLRIGAASAPTGVANIVQVYNRALDGTNHLIAVDDDGVERALTLLLRAVLFGAGTDGDVTIASTTSLARDMNYDDLTVNSGVTLRARSYRVQIRNTLTNAGTISASGRAASASTGGAASTGSLDGGKAGATGGTGSGAAGTTCFDGISDVNVGQGGAGGAGTGTTGGAGGQVGQYGSRWFSPTQALSGLVTYGPALTMADAGAGGGAGGGDGVNSGGGGGGGGAFLILFARIAAAWGTLTARGGAGGTPTAGNCGGGGGGGGGSAYTCSDSAAPAVDASGGAGGSATGTGANGSAGVAGTVRHWQVSL